MERPRALYYAFDGGGGVCLVESVRDFEVVRLRAVEARGKVVLKIEIADTGAATTLTGPFSGEFGLIILQTVCDAVWFGTDPKVDLAKLLSAKLELLKNGPPIEADDLA